MKPVELGKMILSLIPSDNLIIPSVSFDPLVTYSFSNAIERILELSVFVRSISTSIPEPSDFLLGETILGKLTRLPSGKSVEHASNFM